MLYKICLFQILVYLLFIPIARRILEDFLESYSYFAALFFLLFFIIGGANFFQKKGKKIYSSQVNNFSIKLGGILLISVWSLVYIAISINYGLFNRRIGTESAAELFASIPLQVLVVFRSFELILPYFLGVFIFQIHDKEKLSAIDKVAAVMLAIGFIFSGAANSRSQTFFILAIAVVLVQNVIAKEKIKKLLTISFFTAVLAVFFVSLARLISIDGGTADGYFTREFLVRLDGLEVISRLIEENGISLFGLNSSAIFYPIISSIPFLSEANELKATALTTVKSNLIFQEFGSLQGDINSFVLLDVYYWGGMVGVMVSGLSIGLFASWVDKNVGIASKLLWQALAVAIAGNIVYMEREFVSMLLGITRDWFIFYIFMKLFLQKNIYFQKVGCSEQVLNVRN